MFVGYGTFKAGWKTGGVALALAAGAVGLARPAAAQDEKELGWFYTAELTFVLTAGNAEASTLGAGAGLRHVWQNAEFRLSGAGLRTESSTTTRTAVGTLSDFDVNEQSTSQTTAENYYVRSRFDRSLSSRFFVFGGAGWERNTFAGFDNRWGFVAGAGNSWVDGERTRFRTDYGGTLTIQDDIVGESQTFGGLRFSADFWQQLTSTTQFLSALIVDENLKETDDLRGDWTNSLLISISETLAFRTSLQLLWDNLPSLTSVPLEFPAGTPTGESVFVPLDELDTRFTVALVANF